MLPVACLVLPQLHSSAPVVWLALVPLAYGHVRRWNRRYLALGLVLAALLYIPLAIHEAQTGFGNTRAFIAETVGGHKKTTGMTLSFLLSPIYSLRFLTLDVTYHELSGYWGGLNEPAAWHALWHGSPPRPFHPLRLLRAARVRRCCCCWPPPPPSARRSPAAAGPSTVRPTARPPPPARRARPTGQSLRPFAIAALVAVVADVALLAVTSKQVFAHYVTPTLPFVFVVFAAGARAAFADRRLRRSPCWRSPRSSAWAASRRRWPSRGGSTAATAWPSTAPSRARVLDDCAAQARAPADCPARLDFGFMGMTYTHGIFARVALATPIRWEATPSGFAYRLQKRDDPPPPGVGAFPTTTIGPGETLPSSMMEPLSDLALLRGERNYRTLPASDKPGSHYPEGIG